MVMGEGRRGAGGDASAAALVGGSGTERFGGSFETAAAGGDFVDAAASVLACSGDVSGADVSVLER